MTLQRGRGRSATHLEEADLVRFEFCRSQADALTLDMTYGILFEKPGTSDLPQGYYYAHVPALGLTTHGEGIEGARAAVEDLLRMWLTEKRAAGEAIDLAAETFFSTIEISESALQSA